MSKGKFIYFLDYTLNVEVVLGVPFNYKPNEEVIKILNDFRDMVNFCIDYAIKNRITSYAKLWKGVYGDWKKRWDYSTHFCHSACKIALAILKDYRKKKRKGKPEAKKLFMQLDTQLCEFYGDKIRISVRPRQFLYVDLIYGEYQKKFIDAWREGKLRVGEITINESKIVIPFKKDVDLTDPKDWIAIDINENNITGVSSNPHVIRIDTGFRDLKYTYFLKKRKIQKLSKYKPKTSERLMGKYSKREKNRVDDMCHKVARRIVDFAKEHGFGIILEDLRGMKKRIDYGRKMNRRLHNAPFRKIQKFIKYKAKWEGVNVVYVNPSGTSSRCPICGEKLRKAPNGYRIMKCKGCGYENDRDIIACLNLLKMWGVYVPPESLDDARIIELRWKSAGVNDRKIFEKKHQRMNVSHKYRGGDGYGL